MSDSSTFRREFRRILPESHSYQVAAEALKYAAARAAEDRNQAVLQRAEQKREAAEQLRERQAIAAQQASSASSDGAT